MIKLLFSSNMAVNQTGMERLSLELFIQMSKEIQTYHVNKALNKLCRRQITLTHILAPRYHEVLFQDKLKDVFYMSTYIRNFVHDVFEQIEIAQHPYIQQTMGPVKFREILVDCIEKILQYKKNKTTLNLQFHFIQQFGQFQKKLKEKFSISWLPMQVDHDF